MKPITLLLSATMLLLAVPSSKAESPMSIYKRKELEMLHAKCKKTSLLEPLVAPGSEIGEGFMWAPGKITSPRGTWVQVETLRNRAITYRWEVITAAYPRVQMKLALPRDFGSCAMVSLPDGNQRLEVSNYTILIQGDARTLWRRAEERTFSAHGCKFVYPDFKIVSADRTASPPACTPTDSIWTAETLRWIRRAELR